MICATCNKTTPCEHVGIDPEEAVSEPVAPRIESAPSANVGYVPAGPRIQETTETGKARSGPSVVYGAKGDRGDTGATGPAGRDGKHGRDADVQEVVEAARQAMKSEFGTALSALQQIVVDELKHAGVIDSNGQAVLIVGPVGRDGKNGADSTVPGPQGQSIIGPAGRDGVDGKSIVGPSGQDGKDADVGAVIKAAKSEVDAYVAGKLFEFQNGLRSLILQILQERKVLDAEGKAIPGPTGKDGTPGPRGPAGDIQAAVFNAEKGVIEILTKHGITLKQ